MDSVDCERRRPAQLVRPADVRLPRVGLLHPWRDNLTEKRDTGGMSSFCAAIELMGRRRGTAFVRFANSGRVVDREYLPVALPVESVAANSTFELV